MFLDTVVEIIYWCHYNELIKTYAKLSLNIIEKKEWNDERKRDLLFNNEEKKSNCNHILFYKNIGIDGSVGLAKWL